VWGWKWGWRRTDRFTELKLHACRQVVWHFSSCGGFVSVECNTKIIHYKIDTSGLSSTVTQSKSVLPLTLKIDSSTTTTPYIFF
jgi:hypothetical protein